MLQELTLETLGVLDGGKIDGVFRRHLKRAIEDCEDRPGDKKARKVTVEVNVLPIMLQDGAATDVQVECKIKSSVPDHISRPVECRVKSGGRAIFNDLSEDSVAQMTIDEA